VSILTRKVVEKDVAELVDIRRGQKRGGLTPEETHQCERDVCKAADRAERRAKGER